MAEDHEYIPERMEHGILTLIAFDDEAANILCNSVDTTAFLGLFNRKIAEKIFRFVRQYNRAPGVAHLEEVLDDLLNNKDTRKAEPYRELFEGMFQAWEDKVINREYVMSNITSFVRAQALRVGITDAFKQLQAGNIEGCELLIEEAMRKRAQSFDKGISLYDPGALNFLNIVDNNIMTGIQALDDMGVCPAPKELFTIIAPSGRGKTWMMIHLGKFALKQGKKVLHISLEMSEDRVSQRYFQSMFSITKRVAEEVVFSEIIREKAAEGFDPERGAMIDLKQVSVKNRPSFSDTDIIPHIHKELKKSGNRFKLIIKHFPTRSASIHQIKSYLNELELRHQFTPDMIIVDYPDLLKMDVSNLRIELGTVFQDLRGIGIERNCSIVAASQSNRAGEDAKLIDMKHLAEDYSKAAISDVIVTYNQTKEEAKLKLARLYVAKCRNDEAFKTVLITQAYQMGQFALDSARLAPRYWETISGKSDDDEKS